MVRLKEDQLPTITSVALKPDSDQLIFSLDDGRVITIEFSRVAEPRSLTWSGVAIGMPTDSNEWTFVSSDIGPDRSLVFDACGSTRLSQPQFAEALAALTPEWRREGAALLASVTVDDWEAQLDDAIARLARGEVPDFSGGAILY